MIVRGLGKVVKRGEGYRRVKFPDSSIDLEPVSWIFFKKRKNHPSVVDRRLEGTNINQRLTCCAVGAQAGPRNELYHATFHISTSLCGDCFLDRTEENLEEE